jgi:hypothetical protein
MYKKGNYIAFMTKQPEVHYEWKMNITHDLLMKR